MTSPVGSSSLRFGGGGTPGGPSLPTPPTGFAVAAYPTYAQAQAAIEHLSKGDFPIEDVTIVGTDLQLVERVTGRLTGGKLAGAGAASGAWFGLFVGLLMSFYGTRSGFALILVAIAIGALFGAVMGYLGYSVAKGKRDFTSASQVVARRYDVLCQPRTAEQARGLLAQFELASGTT